MHVRQLLIRFLYRSMCLSCDGENHRDDTDRCSLRCRVADHSLGSQGQVIVTTHTRTASTPGNSPLTRVGPILSSDDTRSTEPISRHTTRSGVVLVQDEMVVRVPSRWQLVSLGRSGRMDTEPCCPLPLHAPSQAFRLVVGRRSFISRSSKSLRI